MTHTAGPRAGRAAANGATGGGAAKRAASAPPAANHNSKNSNSKNSSSSSSSKCKDKIGDLPPDQYAKLTNAAKGDHLAKVAKLNGTAQEPTPLSRRDADNQVQFKLQGQGFNDPRTLSVRAGLGAATAFLAAAKYT